MKVTVCLGSHCHLKGSSRVVEKLQTLIEAHKLQEIVDLRGSLCMGVCQDGVSASVNEKKFSLTPETTESFFKDNLLAQENVL